MNLHPCVCECVNYSPSILLSISLTVSEAYLPAVTHTHPHLHKQNCKRLCSILTLVRNVLSVTYTYHAWTHACIHKTCGSITPQLYDKYTSLALLCDGLSSMLMAKPPQKDIDILFHSACQLHLIRSRCLWGSRYF